MLRLATGQPSKMVWHWGAASDIALALAHRKVGSAIDFVGIDPRHAFDRSATPRAERKFPILLSSFSYMATVTRMDCWVARVMGGHRSDPLDRHNIVHTFCAAVESVGPALTVNPWAPGSACHPFSHGPPPRCFRGLRARPARAGTFDSLQSELPQAWSAPLRASSTIQWRGATFERPRIFVL
jgi:hypothetical protein